MSRPFPSTRDLSALPDIATVRRRMQALAVLDAVMAAEWEDRYFSFDAGWAGAEQVGSMRDGEGSHYFAWFGRAGCWIKGFDPEAPLSPFHNTPPLVAEGVLEAIPPAFAGCLREPAFVIEETTFCVWRQTADAGWQHGPVALPTDDPDPDGSARLLAPLDGRPETYANWAGEYYERAVPVEAVRAVYAGKPVTADLVKALNPKRRFNDLRADLDEIGYGRT